MSISNQWGPWNPPIGKAWPYPPPGPPQPSKKKPPYVISHELQIQIKELVKEQAQMTLAIEEIKAKLNQLLEIFELITIERV